MRISNTSKRRRALMLGACLLALVGVSPLASSTNAQTPGPNGEPISRPDAITPGSPNIASGNSGHAHSHVDHEHASQQHAGMEWPPTPKGAGKIVLFTDQAQLKRNETALQNEAADFEQIVLRDSELSATLGKNFKRVTMIAPSPETGSANTTLVYFSRDKNATIEVSIKGKAVAGSKVIPAASYQPELIRDEEDEAILLARKHFVSNGAASISTLQGFAILAYRPEGNGFYDKRVVYVSFHAGQDAPPQFAAWVNLSDGVVMKTLEAR